MLMRTMAAHMPALSLPEAAMLPALTPETPRNLLLSQTGLDFQPVQQASGGGSVDNPVRRGTMAGRALLAHVRNAPARRRRR